MIQNTELFCYQNSSHLFCWKIQWRLKHIFLNHHDYVSLIFNKEDELIGYGIGFPSLAKALVKSRGRYLPTGIFHLLKAIKHPKTLELGLIAVKPEYQKLGVTALIIRNMQSRMIKNGILYADTGCQLEDNTPAIKALDMFDRELIRRKICYLKLLGETSHS